MKSKVLLPLIICFFGSTIISCFHETCDPVPPHFEIIDIESHNMRVTEHGLNPWVTLQDKTSIYWEYFFVRFGLDVNYIASTADFGGRLMALSCIEPGHAGDKVGVDTVIVRTVYDYNETYVAGSVINDIVLTHPWTFFEADFDEFVPIGDYLKEHAEGVKQQTFELKLTQPPSAKTSFSFDVTYRLNDGEEFQHRTAEITLTR